MEVILDELTPMEFFNHGGVVKITIIDESFAKECNVKRKNIFYDYKYYTRFISNLYAIYAQKHPDMISLDIYNTINDNIKLDAFIGNSIYVVDLKYDIVYNYDAAKFYYVSDKNDTGQNPKDPYGIKNVCFSTVNEQSSHWDEYTDQRIVRGFDDSELWDLDGTIARFIYPRLKAFRDINRKAGTSPQNISVEDWHDILDKMVYGFELLALDKGKTKEEEYSERKAIELFNKYFFDLYT